LIVFVIHLDYKDMWALYRLN